MLVLRELALDVSAVVWISYFQAEIYADTNASPFLFLQ